MLGGRQGASVLRFLFNMFLNLYNNYVIHKKRLNTQIYTNSSFFRFLKLYYR